MSGAPGVEALRSIGTSSYPPEPPRRSRVVELALRLSLRGRRGRALSTPHLDPTAQDTDRVRYEYAGADDFWTVVEPTMTLADLDGKDVLDVGCGWGGKLISYAERTRLRAIAGFDLAGLVNWEAPRSFAAERGVADRCTFTEGSAEEIPFPAESFDVAIMDDVMEHVQDPPRALAECLRVLRPGGRVIVKFPSFRMWRAHHLDRAITYPGLHYVLPLRRWAAGLNHHLLASDGAVRFEPFDEVVDTPYRRGVTRNLNGMDVAAFRRVVGASGLRVVDLRIVGTRFPDERLLHRLVAWVYRAITTVPALREILGQTVVFVGERPYQAAAGSGATVRKR